MTARATSRLVTEPYVMPSLHSQLLEVTAELVQMLDREGRFMFVNRAWCETLGWTPEEAAQLRFTDVIHPDMRPHCEAMFAALADGKCFDGLQVRFVSKDGQSVFVEGRVAAHQTASGRFIHTMGFFQNVTARRRRERLTEGQIAVLRAMVGGGSLASVLDGLVRTLEEEFDGCWLAIHLGADIRDFSMRVVAPSLPAEARQLINGGAHCPCLELEPRKSGGAVTVSLADIDPRLADSALGRSLRQLGISACLSLPILDRAGRQLGAVAVFHRGGWTPSQLQSQALDFATQTAAIAVCRHLEEVSLRASEARFRQLVEAVPIALVNVDQAGVVGFVNRQAESLFASSKAALQGSSLPALAERHPSLGPTLAALQALAVEESRPASLATELEVCRPDGSTRQVEVATTSLETADSRCTLFALSDITARKAAEMDRQRLESQIRQKQKLEAIGTLASGIAHDFNNILGAMLNNAELATMECLSAGAPALPAAVLDSLRQISQAGSRARKLVNQILTFGRQQAPDRVVADPVTVIEEVVQLLRSAVPATVDFSLELAPDRPLICADLTQIHQVLLNLGTNAWHALAGSAGRVTLGSRSVNLAVQTEGLELPLTPGSYVCLFVADTGMGMDRETQKRIFDPYFTTKRAGEGTGLGLAVVHGIVERHGGAIRVHSEPGKGTTFEVFLPRAFAVAETTNAAAVVPADPVGRSAAPRVLLVEDDVALAKVTTTLLSRVGFRAEYVADAPSAITRLGEEQCGFDVVIADCQLPGQRGLELVKQMASLCPRLPVLLMSGMVTEELRKQAAEWGVREVLDKPVELETLVQAIRRHSPP